MFKTANSPRVIAIKIGAIALALSATSYLSFLHGIARGEYNGTIQGQHLAFLTTELAAVKNATTCTAGHNNDYCRDDYAINKWVMTYVDNQVANLPPVIK